MLIEAAMHMQGKTTLFLTSTFLLFAPTSFTMATFFLDLPREIRDQIYTCILAPTGLFTITRSASGRYIPASYPGNDEISFNLFRTSQQIKGEAENAFWRYNVPCVSVRDITSSHDRRSTAELQYLRDHFRDKIQKLEMHFELTRHSLSALVDESLLLGDWANYGVLKSICFRLGGPNVLRQFESCGGAQPPIRRSGVCTRVMTVDRFFFKILRLVVKRMNSPWDQELHRLKDVDLRLEIDFGVEKLHVEERVEWLKALSVDKSKRVLERASRSLGEVWVDGVLCYQDGKAIRDIFGEWQIVLERESEILNAEKKREREKRNNPGPWEGNYYELLAED
jgi:hypothetical protein